MAQILIYSRRAHLEGRRQIISDALHSCVTGVLGLPEDKRFHRFIPLEDEDFIHPPSRSVRYTVIEISMFEGRTVETKKEFLRAIFRALDSAAGLTSHEIEIIIHESPKCNWGIRGLPGDELTLSYQVEK